MLVITLQLVVQVTLIKSHNSWQARSAEPHTKLIQIENNRRYRNMLQARMPHGVYLGPKS